MIGTYRDSELYSAIEAWAVDPDVMLTFTEEEFAHLFEAVSSFPDTKARKLAILGYILSDGGIFVGPWRMVNGIFEASEKEDGFGEEEIRIWLESMSEWPFTKVFEKADLPALGGIGFMLVERLVQTVGKVSENYFVQGFFLLHLHYFEWSIEVFERSQALFMESVRFDPKNIRARIFLGHTFALQTRWEEALAALDCVTTSSVLRDVPKKEVLLGLECRSCCLAIMGDHKSAKKVITEFFDLVASLGEDEKYDLVEEFFYLEELLVDHLDDKGLRKRGRSLCKEFCFESEYPRLMQKS